MKRRKYSSSSSDDVDDIPLKGTKRINKSNRDELFTYAVKKCDFCDFVCYNSYNILVHNSSHITVPLIRKPFAKCSCGQSFTTHEELSHHEEKEHPKKDIKKLQDMKLIEKIVTQKVVVKCENTVTELLTESTNIHLRNILKKEAVIECDGSLTELLKANILSNSNRKECNVEKRDYSESDHNGIMHEVVSDNIVDDISDTLEVIRSDVVEGNQVIELDDSEREDNGDDSDNSQADSDDNDDVVIVSDDLRTDNSNLQDDAAIEPDSTTDDRLLAQAPVSVVSRLVFENDLEDEEEDDIVIFDNENQWQNPAVESNAVASSMNYVEAISSTIGDDVLSPSVHYEELIVPGQHKCYRCALTFFNRFELIRHEVSHLSLRQRSRIVLCIKCDYNIAGTTLRRHFQERHPDSVYMPGGNHTKLKKCSICRLNYFDKMKHKVNYHYVHVCPHCTIRFEDRTERDKHILTCNRLVVPMIVHREEMTKVIKVCDMCSLFFKNSQKQRYLAMGTFSKDGVRVRCERCDKMFFEVKLFKMTTKVCKERTEVKKKPVSNESRLKTIQRRIKMINKMR